MAKFQPFFNPDPQSVAGLNSQMVYGENIQFAAGLNHQIALGSNLQLCINPPAMFDDLSVPGSAPLTGLLGSGLGGNLQLTVGTNTSINWGRQLTISLVAADDNITIDGTKHRPLTITMLAILSAACIAYTIGFGKSKDEDQRANLVIAFQVTVDVLLLGLVLGAMFLQDADKAFTKTLRNLFDIPDQSATKWYWPIAEGIEFIGAITALVIPPVEIAKEEGHFNDEQPTPASS